MEQSILLYENKPVFYGTHNECFVELQRIQPYSWDFATRWGGYKVVKQKDYKNESTK